MRSPPHRLHSVIETENDGRSVVSASSAGSATLIDIASQRSNAIANVSTHVHQYRKYFF